MCVLGDFKVEITYTEKIFAHEDPKQSVEDRSQTVHECVRACVSDVIQTTDLLNYKVSYCLCTTNMRNPSIKQKSRLSFRFSGLTTETDT